MFLIWFLSTFSNFWLRAWPLLSKILRTPLEQGSATYIPWAVSGARSQTSIRDPLCDFRKSLATQPNPALKLPQHLTKPLNHNSQKSQKSQFFLGSSTTNRPKTTLKFGEYLFFIFIFFQMIPKRAKLYSNGVKIAIFLGKITNIAQNDPMALGGGCLPATLVCDMLSCTSLLRALLK